jgi:Type II secretion system (T2SS), protein N
VTPRTRWLIALGVLALLAFAVVTLPAGMAAGPLRKAGIEAGAFGGSLWSGRATALSWRGAAIGDAEWKIAPARLLTGRIAGHAKITATDGSIESDFDLSFSGSDLQLHTARFALPLAALDALPLGMPKGWQGRATGQFDAIELRQGWPTTLKGSLDLDGLVAPPPRNAPVGSFHAVFPAVAPKPSLSVPPDPANLTAQVKDKDGPYSVDAQLTLSRARNFAFEGTLAPRGPVPPAMERSLQLLGPADATGRHQFSVGGTL